MKISATPAADALSHLKAKSTSTRKVIKTSVKVVQKVDYPKSQKHGHTIEYDNSRFFLSLQTKKVTKW